MAKQTKRRRPGKRRPAFFRKNRYPLILLGVAALIVVGLVLLARLQERPPIPVVAPVIPPVVKPAVDPLRKVHAEIESLLSALLIDPDHVQRDLDQEPSRYTVRGDFPSPAMVDAFDDRLRKLPGAYRARYRPANALAIEQDRRTYVIVHFLPPATGIPPGPLLAIIMDDLGRSTYAAERLISIPQPVTFSILPDQAHSVEIAELGFAAGREIMLHVPMEPQGYPATNPGSEALFVKYGDNEIRRRFDRLLAKLPHVTGTNNHMGSRFTEDARALAPVMESLQEKGMFFIDSRTTGRSRVAEVARRVGVPSMDRDVFLDNKADVAAIGREIDRLAARAERNGMAIGICHPYPETLEALRIGLPELAKRGITVVPVSLLLRKQALAQGS